MNGTAQTVIACVADMQKEEGVYSMKETELARKYYEEGYSCAEAVWLALANDLPANERNLGLKLSGGFGGGVSTQGLCGALAGAVLGLGLYLGREMGGPRPDALRAATKELVESFNAKYNSSECRDIKPDGPDYRVKCAEYVVFCVEEALRILDEALAVDDCG